MSFVIRNREDVVVIAYCPTCGMENRVDVEW